MKIQEASKISLSDIQKRPGNGFDFKQKMQSYIKEINLPNCSIQQESNIVENPSIIKSIKFETQKNKIQSEASTLLQTSNRLYLFLTRTVMQNYSQMIVYEYLKKDGSHKSVEFNGIKGQILCLSAKFCKRRKEEKNKKSENIKNAKKSNSFKNYESQFQIVVLMGSSRGYLKILRFDEKQSLEEMKFQIQSVKLDYTSIINVCMLNSDNFYNANICLALSVTNKVYLINFDIQQCIATFMATVMSCEAGLSLSINQQNKYFIQTTEGGYIIFWDFSEYLLGLIKKSGEGKCQLLEKEIDKLEGKIQNSVQSNFKPNQIFHCITPLTVFHSATISGIKWCQLYGNLLLLITQTGILKLLAVNSSPHHHTNQNQYCSLLEYQIQDGQLVVNAKFFPQSMEIFVVKTSLFEGFVGKSGQQKHIPVTQFDLDKIAKRSKKMGNQLSKIYKPKTLRELKLNALPQMIQEMRNQSYQSKQKRCYFERIIFNSELQIEKVEKIYPTHVMPCIQSIEMTQKKDILILRGSQFYLIGSTPIFQSEQ